MKKYRIYFSLFLFFFLRMDHFGVENSRIGSKFISPSNTYLEISRLSNVSRHSIHPSRREVSMFCSLARYLKNFYRNGPSGRKAPLSMPRFLLLPPRVTSDRSRKAAPVRGHNGVS